MKITPALSTLLIGETIVDLGRVYLIKDDSRQAFDETLIFRLSNGQLFELMTEQELVIFNQIASTLDLVASRERSLEGSASLLVGPLADDDESSTQFPFTVGSVTEVWASLNGEEPFLMAMTAWDEKRNARLSIYTAIDEIELLSFNSLQERLRYESLAFDIRSFCYSDNIGDLLGHGHSQNVPFRSARSSLKAIAA